MQDVKTKDLQKLQYSYMTDKSLSVFQMFGEKKSWNCEHCNNRQLDRDLKAAMWAWGFRLLVWGSAFTATFQKTALFGMRVCVCVRERQQGQGHSLGFTPPFDILHLPAVLLSFRHAVQFRGSTSRMTRMFKCVFRQSGERALPLGALRCMVSMGPMKA